jgi:hypothetical protein
MKIRLLTLCWIITSAAGGALAERAQVSVKGDPATQGGSLPWAVAASLSEPTDRYPHDVLGGIPSFTRLSVTAQVCSGCAAPVITGHLTLTAPLVFEDVAPRLWDVTGDGRPEVVVVQSHADLGARLTVWALREADATDAPLFSLLAATDYIGTRFRWLAPLGQGDFTGDGKTEIAYVETPHLGRTLRLVGLEGDRLVERGSLAGVTNHRIGEEVIAGGVRDCGGAAEAVLASSDWRRMVAVSWDSGGLISRDLGPLAAQPDWAKALTCPR